MYIQHINKSYEDSLYNSFELGAPPIKSVQRTYGMELKLFSIYHLVM